MGKWRLRWVVISLIVLLNGCADPAPIISPAPAAIVQRDEIQNKLERQMVILFQSLLQMDRRDKLGLSSKQAKELLPLVERNSRVGELEQTDQLLIIAVLSTEQKEFVNDFQERLRIKEQAIKEFKKLSPSSVEEREAMIHDFEVRRREWDAEYQRNAKNHTTEDGQPEPKPGPPPGPPQGGNGSGKNVEQQLIDMLEAKLKKDLISER